MIVYIVNDEHGANVWVHRNLKDAKKQRSLVDKDIRGATPIRKVEFPRNKSGVIYAMSQVPR